MNDPLKLPVPSKDDAPELLPARMLNEYVYCPRLAYMEWVQGEFEHNVYTEDGKYQHRRVDQESGRLAETPDDDQAPRVARSVMLSAPEAGLIAKIDLVEVDGRNAVPVDYKRGRKPDIAEGAHEPEIIQLCAQGIILRENGYECDHGVLYFAGSRDRVTIQFDDFLLKRTLEYAEQFRITASKGRIPPPLDSSPKCNGCSLCGICLPDETGLLMEPADVERYEPRRLVPARDDALPVYVQAQGGFVGKSGDVLVIKEKGVKVAESRMFETAQLNLMGNVQVSTQTVHELCRRGIPIVYMSGGGWLYGMTTGAMHKNVDLRLHQYRAVDNPDISLKLAAQFISAKIRNCRTMLMRNADNVEKETLRSLKESAVKCMEAESMESLLGIEGNAARTYFSAFSHMIKQESLPDGFSFEGRNRRPPRDPVNAMLSLAYSLLVKEFTVSLTAAGCDPYLGFYHKPRYGRPSLALDMMEEFRPIVADSVVISAVNNGVVGISDFRATGQGVMLKPGARRSFIHAYERRMDQLIRHPVFDYRISYRRVLSVQARLLARYIAGEIPEYPEFVTR